MFKRKKIAELESAVIALNEKFEREREVREDQIIEVLDKNKKALDRVYYFVEDNNQHRKTECDGLDARMKSKFSLRDERIEDHRKAIVGIANQNLEAVRTLEVDD